MAITLLNSCLVNEIRFSFSDSNYGCAFTSYTSDCSGNCPSGQECCYGAGRSDVFKYDLSAYDGQYCKDMVDVIIDYAVADNLGTIAGIDLTPELVSGACWYQGIMEKQKIPFDISNNILSFSYSYYNDKTSGGPFGIIFYGRIIAKC